MKCQGSDYNDKWSTFDTWLVIIPLGKQFIIEWPIWTSPLEWFNIATLFNLQRAIGPPGPPRKIDWQWVKLIRGGFNKVIRFWFCRHFQLHLPWMKTIAFCFKFHLIFFPFEWITIIDHTDFIRTTLPSRPCDSTLAMAQKSTDQDNLVQGVIRLQTRMCK